MKKIILASVLVTGVIVSIVLIWKFYPRGNKEVLDIHNQSEVIEEDLLVSLFTGSSLVKGGSSLFLILGIIALAFYYIRQKKQNTSPPRPPPPLPTSAPNTSHSSLPMETFSYSPVPPSTQVTWVSSERSVTTRQVCNSQAPKQVHQALSLETK